jgi:hypothetical protein
MQYVSDKTKVDLNVRDLPSVYSFLQRSVSASGTKRLLLEAR